MIVISRRELLTGSLFAGSIAMICAVNLSGCGGSSVPQEPQLLSLSVTPTNQTLPVGATAQFISTGTYTDHSTQNLTGSVIWQSSVATTATISNAPGTQGLASARGAGSTSIGAALNAVVAPGVLLSVAAQTEIGRASCRERV